MVLKQISSVMSETNLVQAQVFSIIKMLWPQMHGLIHCQTGNKIFLIYMHSLMTLLLLLFTKLQLQLDTIPQVLTRILLQTNMMKPKIPLIQAQQIQSQLPPKNMILGRQKSSRLPTSTHFTKHWLPHTLNRPLNPRRKTSSMHWLQMPRMPKMQSSKH